MILLVGEGKAWPPHVVTSILWYDHRYLWKEKGIAHGRFNGRSITSFHSHSSGFKSHGPKQVQEGWAREIAISPGEKEKARQDLPHQLCAQRVPDVKGVTEMNKIGSCENSFRIRNLHLRIRISFSFAIICFLLSSKLSIYNFEIHAWEGTHDAMNW